MRLLGPRLVRSVVLAAVVVVTSACDGQDPSFDALSAALADPQAAIGLSSQVQRTTRGGAVGEPPTTVATIAGTVSGHPEEVFAALVQSLAGSGYERTEGLEPDDPLSGSWEMDGVRVDVSVGGVPGAGLQSVPVSLAALPG